MSIRFASIGSVSHGTLKPNDLLDSFYSELEYQLARQGTIEAREALKPYCQSTLDSTCDNCWDDDGKIVDDPELIDSYVEQLQEALNEFVPPYCYFGAHPGDGSDFGYWPNSDEIEELPKFNDLSDVPDDQNEDFAIVNDHGNVTVYRVKREYVVVVEFV